MGRPCVPAGGWRAGWQAGWRRGLPRSLWELAGDSPEARSTRTQWRSAPSAAALSVGGGGLPSPGGGVQGRCPLAGLRHSAGLGGGGRGGRPAGVPRRPPSLALVHVPGGCRGWLEGPGPGHPYGRVPLRIRGAARRCLSRAITASVGRSLSCPLMCEWPVGDVRQGGLVRPSLRCARPGLSGVPGRRARPGGLAAGGSVPAVASVRVPWVANGLLWPPPAARPGGQAAGGGGTGGVSPASGGRCPSGEHPGPLVRTPLPRAFRSLAHRGPGRRFGLRPRSPCCSRRRFRVVRRCGGGSGGGVRGRWGRPPRPAVSGQWSAGQRDSFAARVPVGARPTGPSLPACPRPSRSLGSGVTLVLLMPCCADGRGGGGAQGRGASACRGGRPGPSVCSHPAVLAVWGPRPSRPVGLRFPREPTWCSALPPASHAPRSWADPHLSPPPSRTRGAHHRGQFLWQEHPGTPLLLLVVATCGDPERVLGATPTHLYGAAPVSRPPLRAPEALDGVHAFLRTQEVTAVTGVHLVRLPLATPDEPPGPRALSPTPDWGLWRSVWAEWLASLQPKCAWMATAHDHPGPPPRHAPPLLGTRQLRPRHATDALGGSRTGAPAAMHTCQNSCDVRLRWLSAAGPPPEPLVPLPLPRLPRMRGGNPRRAGGAEAGGVRGPGRAAG